MATERQPELARQKLLEALVLYGVNPFTKPGLRLTAEIQELLASYFMGEFDSDSRDLERIERLEKKIKEHDAKQAFSKLEVKDGNQPS